MKENNLLVVKSLELKFNSQKQLEFKKGSVNKNNEYLALKNLNLTLEKNLVYGLIGPNGSGKSTLLKIIFGLLKPTKGSIHKGFKSGKLIDTPTFFHDELSGYDNFEAFYLLNFYNLNNKNLYNEKKKLFKTLTNLQDVDLNKPIVNLSKGMKAKVGFGLTMSFLDKIDFIGLDEFFSFGDDKYKEFSGNYIKNEIKKSGSAILVSHSLDLIESMCDKVIFLENGSITDFGTTKLIIEKYKNSIRK